MVASLPIVVAIALQVAGCFAYGGALQNQLDLLAPTEYVDSCACPIPQPAPHCPLPLSSVLPISLYSQAPCSSPSPKPKRHRKSPFPGYPSDLPPPVHYSPSYCVQSVIVGKPDPPQGTGGAQDPAGGGQDGAGGGQDPAGGGQDPAGGGQDPAGGGQDPAGGGQDPAGGGQDGAGGGQDPAGGGMDPPGGGQSPPGDAPTGGSPAGLADVIVKLLDMFKNQCGAYDPERSLCRRNRRKYCYDHPHDLFVEEEPPCLYPPPPCQPSFPHVHGHGCYYTNTFLP